MEHTFSLITDNVTEMAQHVVNNASLETTTELTTAVKGLTEPSLSFQVLFSIGLIVSVFGSFANTTVLVVLILARRQHGTSVNTLIINQSAMDLSSASLAALTICMATFTRNFVYHSDRIFDQFVCVVRTGTFSLFGVTSGKIGLVIITLGFMLGLRAHVNLNILLY